MLTHFTGLLLLLQVSRFFLHLIYKNFLRTVTFQEYSLMDKNKQILQSLNQEEFQPYGQFLAQLLQAIYESKGNSKIVYSLLETNIDKLNANLADVLRYWATNTFKKPEALETQFIATIISNFSILIWQFPQGDIANNMEIVINNYQVILIIITKSALPKLWATAQNNLGTAYSDRIYGDRTENIENAICAYKAALTVRTQDTFPKEWAATQNNLGLAYKKRINGDRAKNIENAICAYKAALTVRTQNAFPKEWAATQNNLGLAYYDRITGDRAENIENAIAAYKAALTVRTQNALPLQWAAIQNNLGLAYYDRLKEDRAENIENAIAAYKSALIVRTQDALPQQWAATQNNLGFAYSDRIKGDRAENIENAIAAYKAALTVRTQDALPQQWAITQNNLGTAYGDRIKGDRAENIENAIVAYNGALTVYKDISPYEWAMTQNNLGLAYSYRIKKNRADNVENAIAAYKAALTVISDNVFPYKWAMTQNNLGNAYCDRIEGNKAQNLENAINAYNAALTVYQDVFLVDWAMTQNNLGNAYLEGVKENKVEYLEKAIIAYQAALTVRTKDALPLYHAETLNNLGLAYENAKRFNEAYNTCKQAIETVENLRGEIVSGDEIKRKQAEHFNQIYRVMVEVCLQLDKPTEAIEYVERSKTRNLVELILKHDLYSIFPSQAATQLEQLQDKIASGQYEIQNGIASDPKALAQNLQQLRQQYNQLQDNYLPIGYGFKFNQFQTTLDDHTVVVEFYLTNKIHAFIFNRKTQQPIVFKSEFKDLKEFENWKDKYLKAYYEQNNDWKEQLASQLNELAHILQIDKIIELLPKHCDRLVLIPHISLHLFPLHALPVSTSRNNKEQEELSYLIDYFPRGVQYAPSCQLLQLAQTRKRSNFTDIFAIQNPTDSGTPLNYASLEVQIIKNNFNLAQIFERDKATKEALDKVSLNSFHCIHFSCHGYFNFNQPQKSALSLANSVINSTATDSENYLQLTEHSALNLKNCLTLNDIFSVNLDNCRLVVLSACETGLIDSSNVSDEYIGLPSGFLFAGSPTVISSLWKVDDLATTFLLIKFYSNLKNLPKIEQGDMAVALKDAQIWLRNLNSEEGEKFFIKEVIPHIDQIFSKKPRTAKIIKNNARDRLKEKSTYPFDNPVYWSAFITTGF